MWPFTGGKAALPSKDAGWTLHLMWIPYHVRIRCDEFVDSLAVSSHDRGHPWIVLRRYLEARLLLDVFSTYSVLNRRWCWGLYLYLSRNESSLKPGVHSYVASTATEHLPGGRGAASAGSLTARLLPLGQQRNYIRFCFPCDTHHDSRLTLSTWLRLSCQSYIQ